MEGCHVGGCTRGGRKWLLDALAASVVARVPGQRGILFHRRNPPSGDRAHWLFIGGGGDGAGGSTTSIIDEPLARGSAMTTH